jgi:hypothetical protein
VKSMPSNLHIFLHRLIFSSLEEEEEEVVFLSWSLWKEVTV